MCNISQFNVVNVIFVKDCNHFYHTTLCINAVFAVARCPSIHLPIKLVHCIQTVIL